MCMTGIITQTGTGGSGMRHGVSWCASKETRATRYKIMMNTHEHKTQRLLYFKRDAVSICSR